MNRLEIALKFYELRYPCSVRDALDLADELLSAPPKICSDGFFMFRFYDEDGGVHYLHGPEASVDVLVRLTKDVLR
jgi:hypothetical protein